MRCLTSSNNYTHLDKDYERHLFESLKVTIVERRSLSKVVMLCEYLLYSQEVIMLFEIKISINFFLLLQMDHVVFGY